MPKNLKLKLKDPPKTEFQSVTTPYNNLNETVELICKVLCGNPQRYTYTWSNGMTQISQSLNASYFFKINAQSINDTFTIACTVTNDITTTNALAESQTIFNIIHSSRITPIGPTGSKQLFVLKTKIFSKNKLNLTNKKIRTIYCMGNSWNCSWFGGRISFSCFANSTFGVLPKKKKDKNEQKEYQ
jgi:hypothetical protein